MSKARVLVVVALVAGLSLVGVQPAPAASVIVVPTQHLTVQSAVNAAGPGDTIVVRSGTFTEQVTIGKSLTIVGAGAQATTIQAPAVLHPRVIGPLPGRANVVEVFAGATVTLRGLGVSGPSGTSCQGLTGISVQDGATLRLESASIRGCTTIGLFVGYPSSIPVGPGVGHAVVSGTEVTGARDIGIRIGGPGTTASVTASKVTMPPVAFEAGFGISVDEAQGFVTGNTVTGPTCTTCGSDFFTEFLGAGIVTIDAAPGTVIRGNTVTGSDVGMAAAFGRGCCVFSQNTLRDNRFYGFLVFDGDHTLSQSSISGSEVGVAAFSFDVDATATLDRVVITGATEPVAERSCCGGTATVQGSYFVR